MAKFTLFTIITALLASSRAEAFQFRFFKPPNPHDPDANSNCNHSAAAGSTSPPNNGPPSSGSPNNCYSAPIGVNWQRLEIDNPPNSVITFCNVNCQGSGSALQSGTHCFTPFPGCAIGSFKVV
ncbi:hypothetical protein F5144DRAFT_548201 [Chaetomium tenue]|uniref:Uncharacterized protein n=1 Tax=Chaetomium tenue TaxID=1854479 RepID=A0ACB7P7Z2_9PEZI|nr:hypothetical protein F5144DRAFT_548201 [Chaetomium globosum]